MVSCDCRVHDSFRYTTWVGPVFTRVPSKALEDPKVRQALEAGGAVPNYMPAAQFDAYLAAEIKRWGEIIRTRDIKAE